MDQSGFNNSNWGKAADALDRTAGRYLFGVRAIATCALLVVVAGAIFQWVMLDNQYFSAWFGFLACALFHSEMLLCEDGTDY